MVFPLLSFYTLWKHQKNSSFLTFSRFIEMKYEMGLKWVDICSNVLKLYSQGIFCPTFWYLKYNIPLVIAQELPLFFVGSLLTQALNQKLMNTLSFLFFVIGSYCYGLNKTHTVHFFTNLWPRVWKKFRSWFYIVGNKTKRRFFKKTKHAKFSEIRTFLTPWYAHMRLFALLPTIYNPAGYYIFKGSNRNTRTRCVKYVQS